MNTCAGYCRHSSTESIRDQNDTWVLQKDSCIHIIKLNSGYETGSNRSGSSVRGKHGTAEMRANMRLAARSAATHCPRFNAYKQQKLDEGKAEMELRIFLAKCSRGFNYFLATGGFGLLLPVQK